jgi:uncharacterized membrane protein SpoIIM required for sporulation/uncharacterized RDD family membrane protein YckC
MPPSRPLGPVELTRRLTVETPEHVVLRIELAGVGSRIAAALYDGAAILGLTILCAVAFSVLGASAPWLGSWAGAVLFLLWFAILWGYFTLFEALGGGRTPGKRRVGIRVVMDTGHPITLPAALIRNLIRLVDVQPFPTHGIALLSVAFKHDNKRLGDIVAGTIVVRDRPADLALAIAEEGDATVDSGPPLLDDDEFLLLDRLVARLDDLEPDVRRRLVRQMTGRIAGRLPEAWTGPTKGESLLIALHRSDLQRRRAKAASRRTNEGIAAGTAQRFVALRQARWETFRQQALRCERDGLRRLSGRELIAFAGAYRAVAADLARARTYGVDHRVLAYLERIVGAGHNALYGARGIRRPSARGVLLGTLPAAAYRARSVVVLSCLLFLFPGVAGYVLVRERPAIVQEILPAEMIARAEAGEYRRAEGRGYAEAPSPYLPLVASSIITNNVQVAFGAFAFGVTAGVGTVALLAFNGLFFGAVLGLFANYGLATWILTFVAGHGVLELSAIFLAGAGGLLIGRAILAPGDLARRDALVVFGRQAIQLLALATILLFLAGTIEGLLSASGAPATFKLGVSAASLVLIGLLYVAGRGEARARPTSPDVPEAGAAD